MAKRIIEAIVPNVRVNGKPCAVHFKRVRNSDVKFTAKIAGVPVIRIDPTVDVPGYKFSASVYGQDVYGRTPAVVFAKAVQSLRDFA